jgi:hypothetical protein
MAQAGIDARTRLLVNTTASIFTVQLLSKFSRTVSILNGFVSLRLVPVYLLKEEYAGSVIIMHSDAA